jgi:hypothetical protein
MVTKLEFMRFVAILVRVAICAIFLVSIYFFFVSMIMLRMDDFGMNS